MKNTYCDTAKIIAPFHPEEEEEGIRMFRNVGECGVRTLQYVTIRYNTLHGIIAAFVVYLFNNSMSSVKVQRDFWGLFQQMRHKRRAKCYLHRRQRVKRQKV
jgi:hypothetical protein